MAELKLLAEQLGTSERTLRRALAQGTLRGSRPSPRRVDLGAAEKRYLRRSWPLLAALRSALRTEHDVRFVLMFGSAARGEDAPDSDVDLLVETHDSSLAGLADLALKLEERIGRRVDLVRLEEATPHLLATAVSEGRVLVDRDGRWPELRGRVGDLRRRGRRGDRRRTREALTGIDRMLAG